MFTIFVIVYSLCYCLQSLLLFTPSLCYCLQSLLLLTVFVIVYNLCYCLQSFLSFTVFVIALRPKLKNLSRGLNLKSLVYRGEIRSVPSIQIQSLFDLNTSIFKLTKLSFFTFSFKMQQYKRENNTFDKSYCDLKS